MSRYASPFLSDEEVDEICSGLTQNAAKIRFLSRMGIRSDRKPNGRPLVLRSHFEAMRGRMEALAGEDDGPRWGVH